jgi:hypothetical protein
MNNYSILRRSVEELELFLQFYNLPKVIGGGIIHEMWVLLKKIDYKVIRDQKCA